MGGPAFPTPHLMDKFFPIFDQRHGVNNFEQIQQCSSFLSRSFALQFADGLPTLKSCFRQNDRSRSTGKKIVTMLMQHWSSIFYSFFD
mmetsp:Transcript_68475/g.182670  ORF Transcript_68475/g.182670 Transcript_68475/m.182670 type:complete len:88 (-) Transcript_68475:139-402(-)